MEGTHWKAVAEEKPIKEGDEVEVVRMRRPHPRSSNPAAQIGWHADPPTAHEPSPRPGREPSPSAKTS